MLLDNIKLMCNVQGLSLAELEVKAGIPSRSVYRWNEVMPAADKLAKVAAALGTTVEELLD